MANILFLVHRLPYPPNKGDKVRSYHLLKHLAEKHQVYLGTFIDDPEDTQHIEVVRTYCNESYFVRLTPQLAKLRSLNGLLTGTPLTLHYYRNEGLQNWVENTCKQIKMDAAVIFCSAMAQYVDSISKLPKIIDFVDVDSAKWAQYAPNHHWPMSWLYEREGKLLLTYERSIAARSVRSFFVTEAEAALFTRLAPECGPRVEAICNGVDADYFSPKQERTNPYSADDIPLVFTGAMDYLPNIDAVRWFASEMLPRLLERWPKLHFYIVGRNPAPEVEALTNKNITVTGTVPDVRPYLQHATVVVAPLRIARGIQNKILEAMAMAKPVIASTECAAAVEAEFGQELLTATTPAEFIDEIDKLLQDTERCTRVGKAARHRVQSRYSWDAHLSGMDRYITCPNGIEP